MRQYGMIILVIVAFLIFMGIGCAPRKALPPVPRIAAKEIIDSLVAQDTLLKDVRMIGKGKFSAQGKEDAFTFRVFSKRSGKLFTEIQGPFGMTIALLWLCGDDSLCIYLPSANMVLVEPLGLEDPNVILPPAAPVLVDMFCGTSPITRFADSLISFEQTSEGYFLTFQKNNETLVIMAKPSPWRVEEFQWVKNANPKEQVDVKFLEERFTDGIRRPKKIIITAPVLGQTISTYINKEEVNIGAPDSLFEPPIPENAIWKSAF